MAETQSLVDQIDDLEHSFNLTAPGKTEPPAPAEDEDFVEPEFLRKVEAVTAAITNINDPGLIMGGALAGGTLGAPLGLPGVVGFGALGAGAGALAGPNIRNAARALGLEGVSPPVSNVELAEKVLDEVILDMSFGVGIPALGAAAKVASPFVKPLAEPISKILRSGKTTLLKAMGVGEKELAEATAARNIGVGLGVQDVSKTERARFLARTVGRFPLIAGVFQKAGLRRAAQTIEAQNRLWVRMGPTANMADLGIDLNKAADTRFQVFRNEINGMYGEALKLAKATGATLPVAGMKGRATILKKEFFERHAEIGKDGAPFLPKPAKANPAWKFLESLQRIDKRISIERYDGLMTDLDTAMTQAKKDGFDVNMLYEFKKTAEKAINKLDNPEAATLFQEADATFHRVMREVFETPTAQAFNRIEKARFKAKVLSTPGRINADETFKIAVNMDSPQAIRDLKSLIADGKDPTIWNRTVRRWMDNVWNDSLKPDLIRAAEGDPDAAFVPGKIRNTLGLGDKTGSRYASLVEAFKGTDVKMGEVEEFVGVLENALRVNPPPISMFAGRRVMLGGIGALKGLLLPGAAGAIAGSPGGLLGSGAGVIVGVTTVLILRGAGKIVTSPRMLNLAKNALDPVLTLQKRRAAALTLVRLMDTDPEGTESAEREKEAALIGGD